MGKLENGWLLDEYYDKRRKRIEKQLQAVGLSCRLRRYAYGRMVRYDRNRAMKNLMDFMKL